MRIVLRPRCGSRYEPRERNVGEPCRGKAVDWPHPKCVSLRNGRIRGSVFTNLPLQYTVWTNTLCQDAHLAPVQESTSRVLHVEAYSPKSLKINWKRKKNKYCASHCEVAKTETRLALLSGRTSTATNGGIPSNSTKEISRRLSQCSGKWCRALLPQGGEQGGGGVA